MSRRRKNRPPKLTPAVVRAFFGRQKHLRIVTFNMENLFDLIDTGGLRSGPPTPYELEAKLSKLSLALEKELDLPQIVAVQEIKNEHVLQAVGDKVNERRGTSYRAVSFETSDARGIAVGLLFDEAKVRLIEAYQLSGEDVELAFGKGSRKPGREPIVGLFEAHGELLTVVGNHFKSRGGDVPLPGSEWPPEGSTEAQRKDQARAVRSFADRVLASDPAALLFVLGDFNDSRFEEEMESADHPLSILEHGGSIEAGSRRLYDVVERVEEEERFTFDHWGSKQVLDHIFVSEAVVPLIDNVQIPHFNAGFPRRFSGDLTTAIRSSDHDPVVLDIDFSSGA